ncbi:ankyrin-1-like [Planococcus citri]|uniref:ankyrin-1-like n=1 Tax=Planococcus citri TaxID=170843 RepID=UPI0031F79C22
MEADLTYKKSIINGQDDKFGSPLHYVACKNDVETAELLLSNGANPNLRLNETGIPEKLSSKDSEEMRLCEDWPMDYYSWTPLHLAAFNGHNEIVQLLIDAGGKINVVTISKNICEGNTPLHFSTMRNHLKTAQLLLQNGACYDVKNFQNKAPVELTKSEGVADLLQCIHKLFQAVGEGSKSPVHSLLERNDSDSVNAILHAKNSDNHTLLDIAQANEHEEIVDLLNKKTEIIHCDMEDSR